METLSVKSKKPFSLDVVKKLLSRHWGVEASPDETLVVHGPGSRAYVYPDAESNDIDSFRLLVDYSDVELAKALLQEIADDSELIVDNDFGTILSGSEFVARCKAKPGWDWRTYCPH